MQSKKRRKLAAGIKYRNDSNELQDVVIQTLRLICNTGTVKTETRSYQNEDFDKDRWLFMNLLQILTTTTLLLKEQ